ncbi:hypothetical protein AGMMS49975_28520 [Clostridia bacterium]|nr:hypothetical protein AGMMS49975_28520 [Clostridia bacterium]
MVILPTIIVLIIIYNYYISKSTKNLKNANIFIEKERRANSARKSPLPPEIFLRADERNLPYEEGGGERVKQLSKNRLLRFDTDISNTELKLKYGVSQLSDIVSYEENYNMCVKAMIDWARGLIGNAKLPQAASVLEETIRLKSDYSDSYTLLIDIYEELQDTPRMNRLYDKIWEREFLFDQKITRDKIRGYMQKYEEKFEGNLE